LIAALPQRPQVLAVPAAGHNDVLMTQTESDVLIRFLAIEAGAADGG